MATPNQHETAKIYQFRPRIASTKGDRLFENKTVADIKAQKVSAPVIWDSWYHEAAIQSVEPPRKS